MSFFIRVLTPFLFFPFGQAALGDPCLDALSRIKLHPMSEGGIPSTSPTARAVAQWNDPKFFTDPKKYKQGEPYIFLVHGLMDRPNSPSPLLTDPKLISKAPFVSVSVISEWNNGTHGDVGFILGGVTADHVVGSVPFDMGFPGNGIYNSDGSVNRAVFLKLISRTSAAYPIRSPQEILEETGTYWDTWDDPPKLPHEYNEIVILGTSDNRKKVKVTGIFVKVREDGSFICSDVEYANMQAVSYKLKVPLVHIKHQVRLDLKKEAPEPVHLYDGLGTLIR